MKQRRYIMLFGDTQDAVDMLDDAAAGRLLKAILAYARDGTEVSLPGDERLVYRMLMAQFARDEEAYRKKSERNRLQYEQRRATASAVQRDSAPFSPQYQDKDEDHDNNQDQDQDKDKDNDNDKEGFCARARGGERFTPPTPADVAAYCQEAGLKFDPARFCDYNASRGWLVSGRPMTDWRAAARLWASRGDLPAAAGSAGTPRPPRVLEQQTYAQREYVSTESALDQMMENFFAQQQGQGV